MWISKWVLVLGLVWPGAARASSLDSLDNGLPAYDQPGLSGSALRDRVDRYEERLDDLAHETRSLDRAAHETLFKSLALDFHLGGQVNDMRRSLADDEASLDIQDALKAEQARLKALPLDDVGGQDREERKLLGLQSDLMAVLAGLRQRLAGQLKDLDGLRRRDLKDWLMVSAGQLRHRREDAQAAALAHPVPEAPPINAAAMVPLPPPVGARP